MNATALNNTQSFRRSVPFTLETLSERRVYINIPSIIYTFILLFIGIPGNATVFYIYFTRWKKSSTRVFIIALAILDLTNCTLTFPFELAHMFNPFNFDFPVLCKLFRFTTYTCNSGGALLLIAIAVDRHMRICKPYKKPMNPKIAKLISIVIIVTSVATCWPSLIIYGIEVRPITPTIELKFCLIETGYRDTQYPLAYLLVQCACTIVIFIVLVVIYSIIGAQVCRRWKFRTTSLKSVGDGDDGVIADISSINCNDKDDSVWKDDEEKDTNSSLVNENEPKLKPDVARLPYLSQSSTMLKKKKVFDSRAIRIGKTTIMLFVVTIAYILCFSPFLGLASHRSIYPERWLNLSQAGETLYQFFLRSYLANCAINPIIYSYFNRIFRQECVKFYRKLFCTKQNVYRP